MTPIVSVHDLVHAFHERRVLDGVTFTIHEGDRAGFLGANGAGKSTMLSIIAGSLLPQSGEVRRRRNLQIAYLDQDGGLREEDTVQAALDRAFAHIHEVELELDHVHTLLDSVDASSPEGERLLDRQSELTEELQHRGAHTAQTRREELAEALGLPARDRIIGQLSGGERRRTALCRTLLEEPDLLILDEPTNHLDAETLDWLEEYLNRTSATLLFVTHDRSFLDSVATRMIEIEKGKVREYAGDYMAYLAAKDEESVLAQRSESVRQNLLRRELDWYRRQPRARTTKSRARLDRVDSLLADHPPPPPPTARIVFRAGPRLGSSLIEAEDLTHAVAGRIFIRDLTLRMKAGDRIGIVGRNGLGKTTLLRLLMKEMEPNSGVVKHGQSVQFVYADQARANLDLEKTVLEEVAGGLEFIETSTGKISYRSWLRMFLFDEETASKRIRQLSGGERNRVQLAKLLREGGNIIILDEPTNDLDLPTLQVLEEALLAFEGCALIVSHDRWFLNRVATRMLGFHEGGRMDVVEGNYDDYRAYLLKRASAKIAAKPAAAATMTPKESRPARKLTFNEQREFETMEERILQAEEKLESLRAVVEAPDFYGTRGHEETARLLAEFDQQRAAVESLYARWSELSERAR